MSRTDMGELENIRERIEQEQRLATRLRVYEEKARAFKQAVENGETVDDDEKEELIMGLHDTILELDALGVIKIK